MNDNKQIEQNILSPVFNQMDWIIDPSIDQNISMQKGGLAISNIKYCENKQRLQNDRIKAVVSVCGDKLNAPVAVQHLWILVSDHPTQNIENFFNTTYIFIKQHLKRGNVLVHCQAGISRSSSIVIAYLIQQRRISFQEAFQFVRSKRPIALPNKGFTKQLKKLSNQIATSKNITKKEQTNLLFNIFKCLRS